MKKDYSHLPPENTAALVTESGQQALKAVMGINGAAGAALLAFFGDFDRVAASQRTLDALGNALQAFAVGTLLGALAFGFRYLSQASYGLEYTTNKAHAGWWGDWFRNFSALAALAGLIAFAYGGTEAASGLRGPTSKPAAQTLSTISHELPMPRPPYIENQEVKPKE